MGPRAGIDGRKKFHPLPIFTPLDCPAFSKSLHRLHYPSLNVCVCLLTHAYVFIKRYMFKTKQKNRETISYQTLL